MPRVVKVLGQRIEVSHPAHIESEDGRVGEADLQHGYIMVGKHQSPDQQKDTFLHEVLHLCALQGGVDDEATVARLAPILLDFMRRNPNAVNYLTERWSYRAR